MRYLVLLAVSCAAPATAAVAQAAPAQAAPAPAAGKYNTADTDLGTLLDNPDTKAVLNKYIPAMIANDQISMARSMTLKSLQQYAADTLTDETLTKIDADLAKVPMKP